jgi:hypothetical protein
MLLRVWLIIRAWLGCRNKTVLNSDKLSLYHTVIGFNLAATYPDISLTQGPLNNTLAEMR